MNKFSAAVKAVIVGATVLCATCAVAQTWPEKPLRLVVPFPAGGSYDIVARALALKLEKKLGQPVMVDNISGGATVPGVMAVLKEKTDGYTLLLASDGSLNINPHTIKGLRYNPDVDLTPVTIVNTVPHWLVVRADSKLRNLAELKTYIQSHPDKVSISVNAVGGAAHLGLANWKQVNGLKFTIIPYRGSPPAMTDLIGGQTDAHVDVIGSSMSFVAGGKLKPLATLQTTVVEQLPKLETQKADDGKALLVRANLALVVKTGTPQPIIEQLYKAVKSSVEEPDFIARLQSLTYEPVLIPPAQARSFLHAETARYGAIAKGVNLEAN